MGKMKINRTNYEEFVIGYLDGSLGTVETAELLVFLEQNPDLKEEASDLASISLKPDAEILFNYKDVLVQPADKDAIHLNSSNYNHYFVAACEGDLSEVGLKAVESFILSNPGLRSDYELFRLARLKADKKILYPEHSSLKKSVFIINGRFIYLGAVAAVILLLFTVYIRLEPVRNISIVENFEGKEHPSEKPAIKNPNPGKPIIRPIKEKSVNKEIPASKNKKSEVSKSHDQVPVAPPRNTNSPDRISPRHIMNTTPESFDMGKRNFYSELFDDIIKSQEPMLARLEVGPPIINKQPLAISKTGKRINNLIRSGAQIVSLVPESVSGWMLADLGIEGINMLTDNDLKLKRIAKPDGQTERVIITEDGSGYSIGRKLN